MHFSPGDPLYLNMGNLCAPVKPGSRPPPDQPLQEAFRLVGTAGSSTGRMSAREDEWRGMQDAFLPFGCESQFILPRPPNTDSTLRKSPVMAIAVYQMCVSK